jgi:hypothetical protein
MRGATLVCATARELNRVASSEKPVVTCRDESQGIETVVDHLDFLLE